MAQDIYDEIVAAGAPALPVGHFYRIKPVGLFGEYVDVQIRRRFGPFSWRVGSSWTKTDRATPTEAEAIAWGAKQAHSQAFRAQPFARFLGDHP